MGGFRWPRPYRSFKRANARRCELIHKKHAAVPDEEGSLRYDEHPGLEERHRAMTTAALTPDEHAELGRLEELVGRYLAEKFPRSTEFLDEMEAAVRELKAKAEKRRPASDAKASDGD